MQAARYYGELPTRGERRAATNGRTNNMQTVFGERKYCSFASDFVDRDEMQSEQNACCTNERTQRLQLGDGTPHPAAVQCLHLRTPLMVVLHPSSPLRTRRAASSLPFCRFAASNGGNRVECRCCVDTCMSECVCACRRNWKASAFTN